MEMQTLTGREIVEKIIDAMERGDSEGFESLYAEDAVEEWPQSGERVVGRKNMKAINDAYPGMPMIRRRRILGSGDVVIAEVTMDYGDRGKFNTAIIFEVKDGRVVRETTYWAEPFEAPSWRSQWVEKMAS